MLKKLTFPAWIRKQGIERPDRMEHAIRKAMGAVEFKADENAWEDDEWPPKRLKITIEVIDE